MDVLRIHRSLAGAAMRTELQYRANTVIWIVTGIVYQTTGFVFIWVVLTRFPSLAGWTVGEVAFLYGLRLLGHGTSLLVFSRVGDVERLVREAEFDRFLVRPVAPFIQLITRWFATSAIGDFVGGLALFVAASGAVGLRWSVASTLFVVLTVVGAALLETGVKLAIASLTFRFLSTRRPAQVVDDIFSTFANYPTRMFGGVGELLLTFVLPLAFVGYLPASVLLTRTGELAIHPLFAYLAPLAGALVFALAYRFWLREMRQYQSSGH